MGVKAKIPHFALDQVKSMVRGWAVHDSTSRARVFLGGSFQEGRSAMRGVIADLSLRNFSHSVQLTWDMADVYGSAFVAAAGT